MLKIQYIDENGVVYDSKKEARQAQRDNLIRDLVHTLTKTAMLGASKNDSFFSDASYMLKIQYVDENGRVYDSKKKARQAQKDKLICDLVHARNMLLLNAIKRDNRLKCDHIREDSTEIKKEALQRKKLLRALIYELSKTFIFDSKNSTDSITLVSYYIAATAHTYFDSSNAELVEALEAQVKVNDKKDIPVFTIKDNSG